MRPPISPLSLWSPPIGPLSLWERVRVRACENRRRAAANRLVEAASPSIVVSCLRDPVQLVWTVNQFGKLTSDGNCLLGSLHQTAANGGRLVKGEDVQGRST
jgi:hypothetical protein